MDALVLSGHDGPVTGLCKIKDVYISCSLDQSVRVWSHRGSGVWWPSVAEQLHSPVTCLAIDERLLTLYVGTLDGKIHVYIVSSDCNRLDPKIVFTTDKSKACSLVHDPVQGILICLTKAGNLVRVDTTTSQKIETISLNYKYSALTYIAKSSILLLGSKAGEVHAYLNKRSSFKPLSKYPAPKSHNRIMPQVHPTCLSYNNSDHIIVMVGYSDGSINYILNPKLTGAGDHPTKIITLLHKTKAPIRVLQLNKSRGILSSISDSGLLVCWNMQLEYEQHPAWQESDACQRCQLAFFWNLSKKKDFTLTENLKWSLPVPNLNRQHHCRACGRALCDNCLSMIESLPYLGVETPAYACTECTNSFSEKRMTSSIVVQKQTNGISSSTCLSNCPDMLFTSKANNDILIFKP